MLVGSDWVRLPDAWGACPFVPSVAWRDAGGSDASQVREPAPGAPGGPEG
jgi:hypothetical protein